MRKGGDARSIVVEFVGTPGAGKTTFANELVGLLRREGVEAATLIGAARRHAARTATGRVFTRLIPRALQRPFLWQVFYFYSVANVFGFAYDNPSLALGVLRSQLRRPISAMRKGHNLFWFFQLAGRYRFLTSTSHSPEVLVIDDGYLHRSVQLNASHVEESQTASVATYVSLLPRPNLVVHVVAHREICERRIHTRGVWSHSRSLSQRDLYRYVEKAEEVVVQAVGRARELGWTVVEILNEGHELDGARAALRGVTELLIAAAMSMEPLERVDDVTPAFLVRSDKDSSVRAHDGSPHDGRRAC